MPLEPLEDGAPFPLITTTHTDIWVDFWNIVWRSWCENNLGGSGNTSGWPTPFTLNGRIVDSGDTFSPRISDSPSLTIILPEGGKYILGGRYLELEDDVIIQDLPPNMTGWLRVSPVYNEDFEYTEWEGEILTVRPALGAGVIGKITTLSSEVDTFDPSETQSDIILTLPLILSRLRDLSPDGSGAGAVPVYVEDLKYSRADPRNAILVLEEKFKAVLDAASQIAETGGIRTGPSDTDQLWVLMIGLVRGMRDIFPEAMRFMNVGTAKPGIYGTESTPETEQFDLGGTLPAVPSDRNYNGS